MEKKLPGEEILEMDYNKPYTNKRINANTMMQVGGRKKVSLNGVWHFQVDPYCTALRKRFFEEVREDERGRELPLDYDFNDWEKVKVPFCYNTFQDEYHWYEGNAVFTRTFRQEEPLEGKRVFLKIGAANYESKVFLNKQYLGQHFGGYTPYFVEVTDLLEKDNRVILMANNQRVADGVPSINTDWFNYGGLQRDIELIYLPQSYIKDYFIYLKNDSAYDTIVCKIEVVGEDNVVQIEVPELGICQTAEVKKGVCTIEIHAAPVLWDVENPKLYEVTLTYGQDVARDEIGFRQVHVEGRTIFLNGKEIFLRGICAHEESEKHGRALTDEERLENLALAKELGCNAMRLAHYPHHEHMAKFADKIGLLLWEEVPVYWALQFSNQHTYDVAENQLKELILRDRNRASVILWSVGNENPDSDDRLTFMKNLACMAKQLDETRLISAACLVTHETGKVDDRLQQYIDVIGVNEYYGWYNRAFDELGYLLENSQYLSKPLIITETGGDALAGHHGNELFTEEYQEQLYKNQIAMIKKYPYIQGLFPWILYDFRTPVRMGKFQKGYNRKGLLSQDKKYKKLAFYVLQEFYKKYLKP